MHSGSMIPVTVLVAFRLANSASSSKLQGLPKTFVCDDSELLLTTWLIATNRFSMRALRYAID